MKNILLLFLCFFSLEAQTQQLPLFTQYQENWALINPAVLNGDFIRYDGYNRASVGISYRNQWTKIPEAPKTQNIHGEYIFDNRQSGLLLGGYIINDQAGRTGLTGVYGRVAGLITDRGYPEDGVFSMGLNFGLVQYRLNTSNPITIDSDDEALSICDCWGIFPDLGFGLFYQKEFRKGWFKNDNLYAGFSVPQLLGSDLSFEHDAGSLNMKRIQHFYLLLGMYKSLSDGTVLEPSMWVKYVAHAPISIDLNLRTQISLSQGYGDERALSFGGGVLLNNNPFNRPRVPSASGLDIAFHLEFGFLFGDDYTIRIGYGFDYSLAAYSNLYGNSHEFNLSYAFGE